MPVQRSVFNEVLSDRETWNKSSARTEAMSCLRIARTNGGIFAMRQLIAVTERERGLLKLWAQEEPGIADRIAQAVAFREAVLLEFDRLANAGSPTQP